MNLNSNKVFLSNFGKLLLYGKKKIIIRFLVKNNSNSNEKIKFINMQ